MYIFISSPPLLNISSPMSKGSKPEYMAKLLQIVDQKLQAGEVDVTLKFTLSALWNLTDESPSTCEMFLQVCATRLSTICESEVMI